MFKFLWIRLTHLIDVFVADHQIQHRSQKHQFVLGAFIRYVIVCRFQETHQQMIVVLVKMDGAIVCVARTKLYTELGRKRVRACQNSKQSEWNLIVRRSFQEIQDHLWRMFVSLEYASGTDEQWVTVVRIHEHQTLCHGFEECQQVRRS